MATKAKVAVTNLAIGATIKETLTTAASTIATKSEVVGYQDFSGSYWTIYDR